MERTAVSSSNLRSVGYDEANMILEVEFVRSGLVYQYTGVPIDEYQTLMSASSIGTYFSANIAKRYSYYKV